MKNNDKFPLIFFLIVGIYVVLLSVNTIIKKSQKPAISANNINNLAKKEKEVRQLLLDQLPESKNLRIDNRQAIITADESIFREPDFYHNMFRVCDALYENNSDIDALIINNSRTVNCGAAIIKYTSTGSKSYALWYLSYRNSEEEELAYSMYDTLSTGRFEEGIRLAKKLVELHPSAPNYYDLGFFYYKRSSQYSGLSESDKYFIEAEKYYRQAAAKDPHFAPAKSSLAYISFYNYGSRLTDEVEQLFKEAKLDDPNWNFAWMNRAIILDELGRHQDAYYEAKEAVLSNTKFPDEEYVKSVLICINRVAKVKDTEFYTEYEIQDNVELQFCWH